MIEFAGKEIGDTITVLHVWDELAKVLTEPMDDLYNVAFEDDTVDPGTAAQEARVVLMRYRFQLSQSAIDVLEAISDAVQSKPWHVVPNSSGCPASKPYGVVVDATGEVVGCHATRAEADAHVAALYANAT